MTTYELPPEPVTLWRCVRCDKWSHAKRKPKLHQRFVMSPGLGDVIISHETGEDGGYFIQCGPFEEWVARPAGGGGDDLIATAQRQLVSTDTAAILAYKREAALRAVLKLHRPEPYAQGPDYCAECEHRYPCETRRAAEEALS